MPLPQKMFARQPVHDALAAILWFEPSLRELEALKSLLDSGAPLRVAREGATLPARLPADAASPGRSGPAVILLRRAVFLTPPPVRPYFAVCALEAWRRVSVQQLAQWSGIPLTLLRHQLGAAGLTPASVAAWNLALHATWLLDVAELSARAVAGCMGLGRPAELAAILGARAVRRHAGRVESGAFTATLDRYLSVLRAAFRV